MQSFYVIFVDIEVLDLETKKAGTVSHSVAGLANVWALSWETNCILFWVNEVSCSCIQLHETFRQSLCWLWRLRLSLITACMDIHSIMKERHFCAWTCCWRVWPEAYWFWSSDVCFLDVSVSCICLTPVWAQLQAINWHSRVKVQRDI